MQYKNNFNAFAILFPIMILAYITMIHSSCKKYLDKKPNQNIAIPSSLKDLQAILDFEEKNGASPGYLEFVADNYYITNSTWNSVDIRYRLQYAWHKDAEPTYSVWNPPYFVIYYANFVLDYLPTIVMNESERDIYNNIKGQALFYRAFMFYQLAQLFCEPYSTSASTDLGIVLRLTSSVSEPPSPRSTVQQTYDQVIADLKIAAKLLPAKNLALTRPNRAAAFGALARAFLSMRDYANADRYADSSLAEQSSLLDYNSLTSANNPVLPGFMSNPEILYLSAEGYAPREVIGSSLNAIIDTLLYESYNSNDLRKVVFFGLNGNRTCWQGSYFNHYGSFSIFDGIATDEIYLIRAECRARAGDKNAAMSDLNILLRKRWKTGTFTDLTATDASSALTQILIERRKELLFRGLRWSDLRRFNLEGANITLKRIVNGTTYTLPSNDLRWVLLIPDLEISRSGIAQNPR